MFQIRWNPLRSWRTHRSCKAHGNCPVELLMGIQCSQSFGICLQLISSDSIFPLKVTPKLDSLPSSGHKKCRISWNLIHFQVRKSRSRQPMILPRLKTQTTCLKSKESTRERTSSRITLIRCSTDLISDNRPLWFRTRSLVLLYWDFQDSQITTL